MAFKPLVLTVEVLIELSGLPTLVNAKEIQKPRPTDVEFNSYSFTLLGKVISNKRK